MIMMIVDDDDDDDDDESNRIERNANADANRIITLSHDE
jgi:hypothetical protein